MKLYSSFFVVLAMILFGAVSYAATNYNIELIDKTRERKISIAIYEDKKETDLPTVIINHGYGVKNTEYSFIAEKLASQGYFVVSIQHDLENDAPLPETGSLFERRKPIWERGVQNILFIINDLKKARPPLNLNKVILIGHSNGGDIAMMFTEKYPKLVQKIISIDSLRYPFPVSKCVPILYIRANDTKADPGVIQDKGVETIVIKDAKHIDLCDRGSPDIKVKVMKSIIRFLK